MLAPQVCAALKRAALDPRVEGLALEVGPLGVGYAKLEEIRRCELLNQEVALSLWPLVCLTCKPIKLCMAPICLSTLLLHPAWLGAPLQVPDLLPRERQVHNSLHQARRREGTVQCGRFNIYVYDSFSDSMPALEPAAATAETLS